MVARSGFGVARSRSRFMLDSGGGVITDTFDSLMFSRSVEICRS